VKAPSQGKWLTPILLPGVHRKWSLGVLDIGRKVMRIVCDFTPMPREREFLSSVSEISLSESQISKVI
jgi:hypothetical protein